MNSLKVLKNEDIKSKILIICFIIFSFNFSLPSIIYWIKNKNLYKFIWTWTFIFKKPETQFDSLMNSILFFTFISALFIIYCLIVKNHKKVFKSTKQILIVIFIISLLFLAIIPYTSLDVYSYIANGWTSAHYKENPYYVPINEIAEKYQVNDPMFAKVANCWRSETVVYGPLWSLICGGLSALSFGNLNMALLTFKFANVIIHILNCILISKITKRKQFVILYGLNPFILFEAIGNVHNDIFVVFFILLAIYFVLKKKNIFFAVASIAMATAIKYLAILILPFLVLYAVRKKEIKERIKFCIYCGIEYVAIIILFYLLYLQDLQVLSGLFIQQTKYNRSIFFIIYYMFNKNQEKVLPIQNMVFIVFAIYYAYVVIKLLLQKQMRFNNIIRKYNVILLIFTFIIITNFNSWYIMWIFPTFFWLKSKNINTIINLSYASQIANIANYVLWSEEEYLGIPYIIIMTITGIILSRVKNDEKIRSKI